MKAVIQRVKEASVVIGGKEFSKIGSGLLIFLGVVKGDDESHTDVLARKCAELRIFEDKDGKMNLQVKDAGGEVLVVSQFTLAADCKRGRRPSFDNAENPDAANRLYELFCDRISSEGISTKKGQFAARMDINILNDGPVTIILDSKDLI